MMELPTHLFASYTVTIVRPVCDLWFGLLDKQGDEITGYGYFRHLLRPEDWVDTPSGGIQPQDRFRWRVYGDWQSPCTLFASLEPVWRREVWRSGSHVMNVTTGDRITWNVLVSGRNAIGFPVAED